MFWRKNNNTAAREWLKEHPIPEDNGLKIAPDLPLLEQQYKCNLFVCDEMQQGHPMHDVLKFPETVDVAAGFTKDKFEMWKHVAGKESFPIPFEVEDNTYTRNPWSNLWIPKSRIKGEIVAVKPSLFRDLDEYKMNGLQFNRKRVKILIPYTENIEEHNQGVDKLSSISTTTFVEAWMYVGNSTYWARMSIKTRCDFRDRNGNDSSTIDTVDGFTFTQVKTYSFGHQKYLNNCYHFTPSEYV